MRLHLLLAITIVTTTFGADADLNSLRDHKSDFQIVVPHKLPTLIIDSHSTRHFE